jgi:hypothetical protein
MRYHLKISIEADLLLSENGIFFVIPFKEERIFLALAKEMEFLTL